MKLPRSFRISIELTTRCNAALSTHGSGRRFGAGSAQMGLKVRVVAEHAGQA